MAEKRNTRRLFVATRTFLLDGHSWVRLGQVAEEGAPIMARRPDAFRPLVPDYPAVPMAVSAPPPPEPPAEPEP